MTRRIPWGRVVAEGLIIVVSILLAFGIQAWWDERNERIGELEMLVRLDQELDEAVAHLVEWRDRQKTVAAAGREILLYTGLTRDAEISADSLGSLIWTTNFNWSADPPMGVLSSIISTEQLGRIRNQDLITALVQWQTEFLDLRRAEIETAEMNDRRTIPFLEGALPFRSVIAVSVDESIGPSDFVFDVHEVLTDREFESVISNRVVWVDVVVEKYDEVLEGLEATRSLLKAELAARL